MHEITGIEPLTCDSGIGGRDWLFVKVTTDEGIVGWGEGYDWQASPSLAEAIRLVGQEVIGQDPRRIDLISAPPVAISGRAGVPERMKVIAALDLALYDIKGKWLGVPVYDLIGGLYRERIPLYWSHFATYRVLDADALGVAAGRDDRRLAGARRRRRDRPASGRSRRTCSIPGLASGLPPTLDGAIDRWRIDARGGLRGRAARPCRPGHGHPVRRRPGVPDGRHRPAGRALEPFDLYWLEAEGFDPDALLAARRADADAHLPRRGAHRRPGVPALLRAPRHRRRDDRDAEQRASPRRDDRRPGRALRHDVQPAQLHEPASQRSSTPTCAPRCRTARSSRSTWTTSRGSGTSSTSRWSSTTATLVPNRPGWGANVVESEVAQHPLGHQRPEFLSALEA